MTADRPAAPKLTAPQRKALTRYADADERGLPWFGAVDRRLKTMGLIAYVGGSRPHTMHRITEKGRQALGLIWDSMTDSWMTREQWHAQNNKYPSGRISADPIPGAEAAVDGRTPVVHVTYTIDIDTWNSIISEHETPGPETAATEPVETDPWDYVEKGMTLSGWDPQHPLCSAEDPHRLFCTREEHPHEWKHIATGVVGDVFAVWHDQDTAPDLSSPVEADPWGQARAGNTLPGFTHPAVTDECGAERIEDDGAVYNRCNRPVHPSTWKHLDVDAVRYVRAAWSDESVAGSEAVAEARTGHLRSSRAGHAPMQAAEDTRDSVRRRAAILAWMADHPEIDDPRSEQHTGKRASILNYDYRGLGQLCALYRALDLDGDHHAVDLDRDTGGFIRIEAWIGPWKVIVLVDFDEHTDDFCSRLSASDDPQRYLEIISTIHHRADDEG